MGAGAVRHFRPTRGRTLVVLACGLPFALFACAPWWSIGPRHPGWWLGLAMAGSAGLCCVIFPALLLTTSVTVSPAGLAKAPRWNWGFAVEWPQIVSWEVGRPPGWHEAPTDAQVVRFRVAGWRREAVVFDDEVEHPGFAGFVAALREHGGDREAVMPDPVPLLTAHGLPPGVAGHSPSQTGGSTS